MANTHAVVETGLMAADHIDAYVKAVVSNVDMDNGSHIVLGSLVTGDLNTYTASTPTDVTTQEVLIVASPVLVEINGMRINWANPQAFFNPANRNATALHLKVGDSLTISAEGFSSTPTVGGYVVPANGSVKLAPAADLSGDTVVAYQVELATSISIGMKFITAYKLRVVKAA